MSAQFESSIVRIWSEGGSIVGVGFLVDDRKVLTCAHVVASALGIPDDTPERPTDKIQVDFPLVAPSEMLTASVIFWQPVQSDDSTTSEHEEDIAGLEINSPLEGGKGGVSPKPVNLILAEDLWNHEFRAFGFPGGYDKGVYASGVLRGRQTDDWVQIEDVKETGYFISPGFSGGPVWDERLKGVVGMVVAADAQPGVRAAFIIPTEVLISAWPELSERAITVAPEDVEEQPEQVIHDRRTQIGRDAYGNIFIPGEDNTVNITIIPQIQTKVEEEAEPPAIGPNPYQGLSAFHEEDADRFFGREKLTQEIWEVFRTLHETQPGESPALRLLPILGPSGSGKSSLARAGLIPELARRPLPGLRTPRVAVFTPGDHPLEALSGMLARIATKDPIPAAKAREFKEELKLKNEHDEYDGFRRIAEMLPDIASSPLIVLVDQFEEIYSLCDASDERDAFVGNLLHAAAAKAARISVILTLRSDFLGHTHRHPLLNQIIAKEGIIVPAMSAEELRSAIATPAENAGHPLDAATIDLLIAETEGREGALPLLQFALTRIWEGMAEGVAPAETLKKIDGVGGALAKEAQRLYDRLSKSDQTIVRRAFLGMIRLGEGTRDTRRRIPISEIVAHGENPDHVHEVLHLFSQPGARLVTLSADPEKTSETAEVTHEALFEHWETLQDWLDRSRDDLRFQRRLAEAANYWKEKGCPDGLLWRPPDLDLLHTFHKKASSDMTPVQIEFFRESLALQEREKEQHRKILRFRLAALSVIGVLIIAALGVGLWFANRDAERQATIAQQAQEFAEEQQRLSGEAEAARKEAEARQEEAERQARIARARQLATQAQTALEKYPHRSLLLAIEALDVTLRKNEPRVPAAEQALRDALANTAEINLSGGLFAISPDSRWLAANSEENSVMLWNLTGTDPGTTGIRLHNHKLAFMSVVFSPDSHWFVTCSELENTVQLWDLTAPDLATPGIVLRGHEEPISKVAISPGNHWLVTHGEHEKIARLWDLTAPDPTTTGIVLRGHEEPISKVAISPDGRWLVTGSSWEKFISSPDNRLPDFFINRAKSVRLWDLTAADPVTIPIILPGSGWKIDLLAFSPDSHWLVTAGNIEKSVRLWDLTAADPTATPVVLRGHERDVKVATFSPDSHWLVTVGDWENIVQLWDLTKIDQVTASVVLRGHEKRIEYVAFSPDSHWLVTGSTDNTVLWDLTTVDPTTTSVALRNQERTTRTITFSPDSRWLVTNSGKTTVRLWDLTTSSLANRSIILRGHEREIEFMAFSPDSHWLVTGSTDNTFLLWDLTAADPGVTSVVLRSYEDRIRTMTFSPDGRWLVLGSKDNIIRLWMLQLDELIDRACRIADRNLSYPEWDQYFQGDKYRITCPAFPIHSSIIPAAQDLARSGDIEGAMTIFERMRELDFSLKIDPKTEVNKWRARGLLENGERLAQHGRVREANATYTEAQTLDPTMEISAQSWNTLCRNGSLWGYADEVINACEQAVRLDPQDANIRDSRGLARALTGDIEGAIVDFQAFVDWADDEEKNLRQSWVGFSRSNRYIFSMSPQLHYQSILDRLSKIDTLQKKKLQRQHWIDILRGGENPFTPTVLEKLRPLPSPPPTPYPALHELGTTG